MPRVVLTGGPGVGKTSLLRAFEALGHAVVRESAREIIRERTSQGLAPRPDPVAFASAVSLRDLEKYALVPDRQDWVFFDRSPLESLAMLQEAGAVVASAAPNPSEGLRFHNQVFVLPPWDAIYVQDQERDHSFEHCEQVHARLVALYGGLGFTLIEVPRMEVQARVEYVLRALAESTPNPSVEARPNGKAPGPAPGVVYHPSAGPGASPSAPPHLER